MTSHVYEKLVAVTEADLAELNRRAARWDAWAAAAAEASGLSTSMGELPFFKALAYHSGFGITRKFTADQLGGWVDIAAAEVAKEQP